MAMIPWKWGGSEKRGPLTPFHTDFDKFFENFFRSSDLMQGTGTFMTPALDIWETEHHLRAKMEIPGMDAGDIDVNVQDDLVTVSGERRTEEKTEKDNTFVQEMTYGSFQRSFRLPGWADGHGLEANYKNGILELSIPKREEAKAKTFKVKVKP